MFYQKQMQEQGEKIAEVVKGLSEEYDVTLIKGTLFRLGKIIYRYKNWKIKIYFDVDDSTYDFFVNFSAPFINESKLKFVIRQHLISEEVTSFFGFQDIQVDDEVINKRFLIKGNDENIIKQLFNSERLIYLLKEIDKRNKIEIKVKNNEGIIGPIYPKNVDTIFIEGVYNFNFETAKIIIQIIEELLDQLLLLGYTINEETKVNL